MSGITDSLFRRMVKEASPGAVGLVVTELISVEGMVRRNDKTLRMLDFEPEEAPLSVQLFGSEPERMAEGARLAADRGAAIVDVNCGCPVPKVVRKGGGAELMRQPLRLAAILRAIRRAVSVPVTVKIRAGWDDRQRNAVEVARMLESEGAAMVAVHGRTRLQLYGGRCDWDLIGEVKAAVTIPVVGSGDVTAPEHAIERLNDTGVDGVMIGRAALSNPWIFTQIEALRSGRAPRRPTPLEAWSLVSTLVDRIAENLHPRAALGRARGLVCRMTKGLPNSAPLRESVTRAPSIDAILALLRERCAAAAEETDLRAA